MIWRVLDNILCDLDHKVKVIIYIFCKCMSSLTFGHSNFKLHKCIGGAQWLSGRVLELRQKGRRFKPHRRHCVVVLEQDTFILA